MTKNKLLQLHFLAAICLAGVVFNACKPDDPQPDTSIILLDSLTIAIGESQTLLQNTAVKGVRWTSGNVKIATVDSTGKVTAIAIGNTIIYGETDSKKDSCIITVIPPIPVDSIRFAQKTILFLLNESIGLKVSVYPENATNRTVIWKSSYDSIATVDATGKIAVKKEGSTTIYAKAGNQTDSCKVTVVNKLIVTTQKITIVSATAATFTGEVNANTEKGFCYSTSPNPTIAGTKLVLHEDSAFSAKATKLEYGIKYYVRAYATSAQNAVYSKQDSVTITVPENIVINGVTWATCNIDTLGIFAKTPESAGKLYQWNCKTTLDITSTKAEGWSETIPQGTAWEKANDPSHAGYRIPRKAEMDALCDTSKVTNEWTTRNGVAGRKFTDKLTDNYIFLPAVGSRNHTVGLLYGAKTHGFYWSSTAHESEQIGAYRLRFNQNGAGVSDACRRDAYSIRPVAK